MIDIVLGYLLDLLIGEPQNPIHPVRLIAKLLNFLEKLTRKIFKKNLKFAGLITFIIAVFVTYFVGWIILKSFYSINIYLGHFIEIIIIYTCVSTKGLKDEGLKVIKYIKNGDIITARKMLSYIVGRDTENLDEKQVMRAVIETIAENISDGIIAPLIFIGIGGAPLGLLYKAVNTMDSMFGYKNEKYMEFGFFPAKLDDVFNFIPSRISGVFIIIASYFLKLNYKNSYKIFRRDRLNHKSPNSANPESAVAGAIDILLGGTSYYFNKPVVKQTIGDDVDLIEISKVYDTVKILYVTSFLGLIFSVLINAIILKI